MTISQMGDYPQFRRNRNLLPVPNLPTAGDPGPGEDDALKGWDVEEARMLLVPRSQFSSLFGLTQKDIDRATDGINFLAEKDSALAEETLASNASMRRSARVAKRTLDLVLSAVALLVLAPVLAVIAISVRLDTRGPALFRQTRVGRNGREFTMYKFRSMVVNAEQALDDLLAWASEDGTGLLFKIVYDPRVTRVGRVLRKYSLDELPQLWNVLVGDMSLVGPRPPLPSEVKVYDDRSLRQLYVKPGLTGLWQINGRSDLSWEESIRLDLYYAENWSLTGDLVIMWRTVRVLTRPVGTY